MRLEAAQNLGRGSGRRKRHIVPSSNLAGAKRILDTARGPLWAAGRFVEVQPCSKYGRLQPGQRLALPWTNRRPSAISLYAWREDGDKRYNLVLQNRGHYREIFASVIGREGADAVIANLAANRAIQLPGAFTTRQLSSLGFRNLEQP